MQNRHLWKKLLPEIDTQEIVVITGARQVGKTTTLHWLLDTIPSENKYYFDLENLIDRELFETKNYDSLIHEFQTRGLSTEKRLYIALDEIQLLPNLPSVVKYLYDHYQIKFFLTGSSSYYIKNRFSESMAGRKIVYEMFPLSFQEFLDFQGVEHVLPEKLPLTMDFPVSTYELLRTHYEQYIEYGGLPKVVLTVNVDRKKQLLEEIFSSYINLDVQTLSDFKSTNDLRKVIKLLASRIGSRLNVSELANVTGLSRITIDNYIEFLEQTYLIRTIPVFSRSQDVQNRLLKKPYFVDTGIANVNADLSGGSKFENTICNQLSLYGDLSYFANRDGEVDFILNYEGAPLAFEVKETPTRSDDETLKRRIQNLDISQSRIIGKEQSARFTEYLWGGLIR
ncbi:MAG: ATP-binding protein [bacterium]